MTGFRSGGARPRLTGDPGVARGLWSGLEVFPACCFCVHGLSSLLERVVSCKNVHIVPPSLLTCLFFFFFFPYFFGFLSLWQRVLNVPRVYCHGMTNVGAVLGPDHPL